jgi:cell division transport system ATP-binding protein
MQLLYRINRTGTTVVVVTHDHQMVDKMRRRVIELSKGQVIRDQRQAGYAVETTGEMDAILRDEPREPWGEDR